MPTVVTNITVPRAVMVPRGDAWAAAFAAALAAAVLRRVGLALWRALEATGQARARRNLLEMAERRQADAPALAQELRAAANFLHSAPHERAPRSGG